MTYEIERCDVCGEIVTIKIDAVQDELKVDRRLKKHFHTDHPSPTHQYTICLECTPFSDEDWQKCYEVSIVSSPQHYGPNPQLNAGWRVEILGISIMDFFSAKYFRSQVVGS